MTDASPVWISKGARYEAPGSDRLIVHKWGAPGLSECGMDLATPGLQTIRADWATALDATMCRNCQSIIEHREAKP